VPMSDPWFTLKLLLAISSGVLLMALLITSMMVATALVLKLLARLLEWLAKKVGG